MDGVVSKRTINLWIKKAGSIEVLYSSGRPRTARTTANVSKTKGRLDQNKRVSTRLAAEIKFSKTSAHRILHEDLGCFPFKKIKQPKLTNLQKQKRVTFANWALNNYTKDNTKRWHFLMRSFFDLDEIYWVDAKVSADFFSFLCFKFLLKQNTINQRRIYHCYL